jgi:hypothetical protein
MENAPRRTNLSMFRSLIPDTRERAFGVNSGRPRECAWWKELVLSVSPVCSHANHTQPIDHAANTLRIRQLRSVPLGFDSHRPLQSQPTLANNSQDSPCSQAC